MCQGVDLGCSNGQRVDRAHGFPGAAVPGQMADESGQGDGLAGLVLDPLQGLSGGGELAKASLRAGQLGQREGSARRLVLRYGCNQVSRTLERFPGEGLVPSLGLEQRYAHLSWIYRIVIVHVEIEASQKGRDLGRRVLHSL